MARLGLAGSSGNSSGTTAIEVPRTFEEQLEEAHGVGDEYLAEAMEPDSNSVVHPLAAMIVTDSRQDVRGAASQPPMQTVAQEKVMNIQGGLGSQPRSYTPPILDRGYARGGMVRGYKDGSLVTAEEEHRLENPEEEIGSWKDLAAETGKFFFDPTDPWDYAAGALGAGAVATGGLSAYPGAALWLANRARKARKIPKILGAAGRLATFRGGTPAMNRAAGRFMGAGRKYDPRVETMGMLGRGESIVNPAIAAAQEGAGKMALRFAGPGAAIYGGKRAYDAAFGGGGDKDRPESTFESLEAERLASKEFENEFMTKFEGITGKEDKKDGVDTAGGGDGGGGEDHPRKMHPYMKFLRDAYDRDRIYGEESKKEARAMLMLQMASNLSQPGATVGRAFDNLAPLVAAQGQERRRSDENTRNVLSEISLAMHRGEIDLTDSETRNMIGVANALSRERESKANVTRANRGGRNELKSYELAMKTALAEVGGYRNEKNEEKYQELLAKYLTEFSRFDA